MHPLPNEDMIINSKIVLAFAAGAMLASGIVYVALKPSAPPRHVAAVALPAPPVAKPAIAPAPAAEPEPPKPVSPKSVGEARHAARAPQYAVQASAAPPPDDVPASVRTDENPPPAPAPQVAAPPVAAPAPEASPEPEPAPEPVVVNETPPPAPAPTPPPAPNTVTLQPGTLITVRLAEALSSDKNVKDDTFLATLDQPLAAGGFVIAERGARVEGRVVDAVRGRGDTVGDLSLALTKLHTSDGQQIGIETTAFDRKGQASGGQSAAKVGGGAVLGAILGAAVGGGRGAGIGAAAGGAAGAGGAVMTRGRTVTLPTETRISFTLQQAVTITERAH